MSYSISNFGKRLIKRGQRVVRRKHQQLQQSSYPSDSPLFAAGIATAADEDGAPDEELLGSNRVTAPDDELTSLDIDDADDHHPIDAGDGPPLS